MKNVCVGGCEQHIWHGQCSGLACVVVGSDAFAQPADLCAGGSCGAGVHELVVVPAQPDERLGACREQAVRLEEVWEGILRAQCHAVMLDAALHSKHPEYQLPCFACLPTGSTWMHMVSAPPVYKHLAEAVRGDRPFNKQVPLK